MSLLVLVFMCALVVALGAARRWLSAEASRKALHAAMGLGLLVLPMLHLTPPALWLLALAATALLVALRTVPALRRRWGCVLHDVARRSYGDLCYPAAVLFLIECAPGEHVYAAALLSLALADPAAALVGQRWPLSQYRVPGGTKTLAGTGACLAVSGLVCVPLLGWEIGGAMALAAAAAEGLTGQGFDNLIIPVVVVAVAAFPALFLPLAAGWLLLYGRRRRVGVRHRSCLAQQETMLTYGG